MPFDSGSRGRSRTSLVPSMPVDPAPPRHAAAAADASGVPDKPPQLQTQPLEELSGGQQQVLDASRVDHLGEHEVGLARGDHQHRQQHPRAVLERDLARWEPQVTLFCVPGSPHQPVSRIAPAVPRA